ncbi:MAG: PHP domain-containing protein, partial [Clostridia bacterium]|nr:PHP domain-containing protein [Clostridia bacterium]
MRITYDFHLHSCLSPCSDDEMTPNNIVNMAYLAGLNAIAITDHNSCANCAAVMQTAAANFPDMTVLPGMELETSEEVHIVCLFPALKNALDFEQEVRRARLPIPNRKDIYGNQLICNAEDEVVGEEEQLLVTATSISVDEVPALVKKYGGVAVPAHVDRPSYSLLSNLGFISEDMGFDTIEISRKLFGENAAKFLEKNRLVRYNVLMSSDAHELGVIGIQAGTLEVDENSAEAI